VKLYYFPEGNIISRLYLSLGKQALFKLLY
jgi:hypothetical protein